jgi:hypothetical protein
MEKTDLDERVFEYPYDEALRDIKRWREHVDDVETPHAYFLHKADLLFLINELMNLDAKGLGIRCYPAKHASGENHLLMVAVVEEEGYDHGRDVYNDQAPAPSRIFDLSRPCPNMCDYKSNLFIAGIIKEQLPLRDL